MTVPVIWWNANPEAIARGYWDQSVLEDLFAGRLWRPARPVEFEHYALDEGALAVQALIPADSGAVVVVPARHNADEERVNLLVRCLDQLSWAFVILTGDEEGIYPWRWLLDPEKRRKVWHMNGRPDRTDRPERVLGSGYSPGTREAYANLPDARPLDWFFAGQVTHRRRRECVTALRDLGLGGRLVETEGFTEGIPHDEYLEAMARARVAPCPSGPASPDSFRLYEALEAGTVPITERHAAYWDAVLPGAPWPMLERWESTCTTIPPLLTEWSARAADVSAWWIAYKRGLAYELHDQLRDWVGDDGSIPRAKDEITVIVPTSPVPSHPDTAIIEQTVESIRAHLPDCEIIVACDGVRSEQENRAYDYAEYLRRLTVLCLRRWSNVWPVILPKFGHQANATRAVLPFVRTPLILFVEHDTPLTGPELPIDWEGLGFCLHQGDVDVIRLHHETAIGEYHRDLMLGEPLDMPSFVRLQRTRQWSQRPHLSTVAFYTRILDAYFGTDGRSMIEDVMHGVVADYVDRFGMEGWDQFKVAIYLPDGDNIQRSTHSDGRAGDPKYGQKFAYDGRDAPAGAPTARDESETP